MTDIELLIDLHVANDRQGPGSDEETRRAAELARLPRDRTLDILDIACGTGASTLALAGTLDARFTAIDASPAFVERLRERARDAGLAQSIRADVGQMERLPFADASFDVVWCEAAIYNIGFEPGVRAWRRLLRPGGVLAVSELTWTSDTRPEEIDTYWRREYPAITTMSANIGCLDRCGYHTLGAFFTPSSCWEQTYFDPLRAGFDAFLERHASSEAARAIVENERAEMDLYRRYGDWFGYAFYLARKPLDRE